MVEHVAGLASPLATMVLLVVVTIGIALGLMRRRQGSEASDSDGWSAGDDGHCAAHDVGSCDGN